MSRRSLFETLESRQLLAADYVVTTLDDVVVAGEGVVGADNQWSLREALLHSNADSDSATDTIQFAPSLVGGTIQLSGAISINTNVEIIGPGSDQLTIDAKVLTAFFISAAVRSCFKA